MIPLERDETRLTVRVILQTPYETGPLSDHRHDEQTFQMSGRNVEYPVRLFNDPHNSNCNIYDSMYSDICSWLNTHKHPRPSSDYSKFLGEQLRRLGHPRSVGFLTYPHIRYEKFQDVITLDHQPSETGVKNHIAKLACTLSYKADIANARLLIEEAHVVVKYLGAAGSIGGPDNEQTTIGAKVFGLVQA